MVTYDADHCMYLIVQVDQLAEMISTVFMVHHGSNLQSFQSLNISSIILATEMGLTAFFMQVEEYIKGTIDLVTNLPAELAGLPQNVRPPLYQPAFPSRKSCQSGISSVCNTLHR